MSRLQMGRRGEQEYARLGPLWVETHERDVFLNEHFTYNYGDHLGVYGPTQVTGKTRLLSDLLQHVDTSGLAKPPCAFIAKPKDKTWEREIPRLGYRVTDVWPPKFSRFRSAPPGYAFWPRHTRGVPAAVNNGMIAGKFSAAMDENYWSGNSITVIDELYHAFAMLKLDHPINRHLTQGMGMGSALWFGTQKPSGTQGNNLSGFVFNSPVHTFIARDPVGTNQKKLGDIGGVDPKVVEAAAGSLPRYWFLYLNRDGTMCVVKAGR